MCSTENNTLSRLWFPHLHNDESRSAAVFALSQSWDCEYDRNSKFSKNPWQRSLPCPGQALVPGTLKGSVTSFWILWRYGGWSCKFSLASFGKETGDIMAFEYEILMFRLSLFNYLRWSIVGIKRLDTDVYVLTGSKQPKNSRFLIYGSFLGHFLGTRLRSTGVLSSCWCY